MRKIFQEAINKDLFLDFKNEFVDVLLQGFFSGNNFVELYEPLEPEDDFDLDSYVFQRVARKFNNIEKVVFENISEFSMQEKFYYISQSMANCESNKVRSIKELSQFFDIAAKAHLFGKDYMKYKNEFDEVIVPKFENYGIDFLSLFEKLNNLFETLNTEFQKGHLTDESHIEVNEFVLKHKPLFTLHPDFKISCIKNGKIKPSKFNKNQIAILIEFLCEYEVFLDFDKHTKAFFASLFTGQSEQNLYNKFIDFNPIINGKESSNPKDNDHDTREVQMLLDKFKEFVVNKRDKKQNKK